MKNTLLISLITVLLFACKDKTVKNNNAHTDTTHSLTDTIVEHFVGDTLTYEVKSYDKKIEGCANEKTNCASFIASFPVLNVMVHGKVADSINNFIRAKLYYPLIGDEQPNGLNDLLRPYFDAYKETLQTNQNEGEDSIAAWSFKRNITVHTNTFKVFTLVHSEKSYAGGAHPNSFSNYYHFNPKDGKRFYLNDFFKLGFEKELTAIAEKKFRKQLNISPKASLEDEGFWFKTKKFSLNENFWWAKDGLHFLYNPYEVAAPAVGAIEVVVNYNDIYDLVKEEHKTQDS